MCLTGLALIVLAWYFPSLLHAYVPCYLLFFFVFADTGLANNGVGNACHARPTPKTLMEEASRDSAAEKV